MVGVCCRWHHLHTAFLWILLLDCYLSVSNNLVSGSSSFEEGDVASSLANLANDDEKFQRLKKGSRVALLTASYPWLFGPYQTQMYHLSVYLAQEYEFDILWLPYSSDSYLPIGEYESFAEVKKHFPSIKIVDPPDDFGPLDHLTYCGFLSDNKIESGNQPARASHFNRIAREYRIDALVVLQDIVRIFPNAEFDFAAVGWLPIHSSEKPIRRADIDHWVLRNFHSLAILSPTSLKAVQEGLADDARPHTITATHVPHYIDRLLLQKRATQARRRLKLNKPVHKNYDDKDLQTCEDLQTCGDVASTTTDKEKTQTRKFQLKAEKRLKTTFNNATKTDTFLVLGQGGNYDEVDRKGWDVSIQAYSLFHERVSKAIEQQSSTSDDTPPLLPVHFYIHCVESNLIDSDIFGGILAPSYVLSKGMNLFHRFYYSGVPRDSYTIDGTIHEPEVVDMLKDMASVCLLPAQVEGFGMNVIECQALGTPVVTLNHTATGDFTKLGRTVKVRQRNFATNLLEFAQPDAEYLADALWELYLEHNALVYERKKPNAGVATIARTQDVRRTMDWVDTHFSIEAVGQGMYSLLNTAVRNLQRRKEYMKSLKSLENLPTFYNVENGDFIQIRDREPHVEWIILSPPGLQFDHTAINAIAFDYYMKRESTMMLLGSGNGKEYDDMMMYKTITDGSEGCPIPLMVPFYFITALSKITASRCGLYNQAMSLGPGAGAMEFLRIDESTYY